MLKRIISLALCTILLAGCFACCDSQPETPETPEQPENPDQPEQPETPDNNDGVNP